MNVQQFNHIRSLLEDIRAKLQLVQTQLQFNNTVYPSIEQKLRDLRERSLDDYRRKYERQHGNVPTYESGEDEID